MFWQRFIDTVIVPLWRLVLGFGLWGVLTAALTTPVFIDGFPPEFKPLWFCGSVLFGLYFAGLIMRGVPVRTHDAREGVRRLGETVRGGKRDGR